MSDKHTQGPWEVRCFGGQFYVSSVNSVRGSVMPPGGGRQAIASLPRAAKKDTPGYHEMFEANARLIAAAPDLLDAVQKFLAWSAAENDHKGTSFWERVEMLRELDDAANAVVAKATGRLA